MDRTSRLMLRFVIPVLATIVAALVAYVILLPPALVCAAISTVVISWLARSMIWPRKWKYVCNKCGETFKKEQLQPGCSYNKTARSVCPKCAHDIMMDAFMDMKKRVQPIYRND